jgi:hypothetical protein
MSMEAELGWKDGIIAVLNAARAPMHYVEIAEKIFDRGLRTEQTATPAATVAATIAQSFKNDGEHSPFIRVGRGVYALRGVQNDAPVIAQNELAPTESSEVTGLVNAFGMFWDRAKVSWDTKPRILRAATVRIEAREFLRAAGGVPASRLPGCGLRRPRHRSDSR